MKVAVVGRGLIGSAAARHLAKAGHETLLIGPDEPQDWASHGGVFASHYDEGRITRKNDRRAFFARVSTASIARYAEIEAESGISFFTPCGALIAAGKGYMAEVDTASEGLGIHDERLEPDALARKFPFFHFPPEHHGAYEPAEAGHISPRRLVAAQCRAAERHGARIIPCEARSVDGARVVTAEGTHTCDEVLVAAGGWSDLILSRPPKLTVRPRTVALFEIGPSEAARLATMPSLVFESENGAYVLPPIRYPDGKLWLKIGGDPEDRECRTYEELNAWFRTGGDPHVADYLTRQISALIPGLRYEQVRMAACVTSWTETGLPEIRRLGPGLSVATGGNGAGAKCSDELGRLASEVVLNH